MREQSFSRDAYPNAAAAAADDDEAFDCPLLLGVRPTVVDVKRPVGVLKARQIKIRSASATRRLTVGVMHAPQHGSPALIAGVRIDGKR